MSTNLIASSYKKSFIIYCHFKSYLINLYELNLLKSSLKLQNLIIHYIFIFSFKIYKTFICQNDLLRFDPIHSPKFDYGIPDRTRSAFIIIEKYYRQCNNDICMRKKTCSLHVSLSTHYYLIKINGGPLGNYKFISHFINFINSSLSLI